MSVFTNEVEAAVINFPVTQTVNGTVSVGNFPAVQPVDDNGGSLTIDGTVSVNNFPGGSVGAATVTRVAVSTTAADLAVANASRIKLIIHNETGTLFVKFGSAASSADYTYRMTANTTLEVAQYTGVVSAIKATGSSFAQVTEL